MKLVGLAGSEIPSRTLVSRIFSEGTAYSLWETGATDL